MDKVYLLEHLHIISENNECVKTIGIYASEQEAIAAVGRLKEQPGFSDFPNINPAACEVSGFYISCYPLGKDYWAEGFVIIDT